MSSLVHNQSIAIIGTGCQFPGQVENLEQFWQMMSVKKHGIRPIDNQFWDQQYYFHEMPGSGFSYAAEAGLLDDTDKFDAGYFSIGADEASAMDPQQRLLLKTCVHALEDAGVLAQSSLLANTGLCVGMSTDDYAFLGKDLTNLKKISPYSTLGTMRSIAAGRLAYLLNLHGPVMQLDTACSSSLMAVHTACQQLLLGEADCMLAAGVNLILSPRLMVALSQLKALSPTNRCHVFDQQADGYVRGEGCGVVVLKRLSDAQAQGDRILAVIESSAANHDGASNGLTAPNGLAQQQVIEKALKKSSVDFSNVNYVEAHGTGTLFGDPIEVNSLGKCYVEKRKQDNPLFLGSVKTNVGHLEAAAGIAGLLKVVICLRKKKLAPSLNFTDPNPHINWHDGKINVVTETRDWPLSPTTNTRLAAVSAFGFSGTNVHMLLAEYQQDLKNEYQTEKEEMYLLPLSAASDNSLRKIVTQWLEDESLAKTDFSRLVYTASVLRPHYKKRLLFSIQTFTQLKPLLQQWLQNPSLIGNQWLNNLTDTKLQMLGQDYLAGKKVDWSSVFSKNMGGGCELPVYPFDEQSYWLEPFESSGFKPEVIKKIATEPYCYQLVWEDFYFSKQNNYKQKYNLLSMNETLFSKSGTGHWFAGQESFYRICKIDELTSDQFEHSADQTLLLLKEPQDNNFEQYVQNLWQIIREIHLSDNHHPIWIMICEQDTSDLYDSIDDNFIGEKINLSSFTAAISAMVNGLRQECTDNAIRLIQLVEGEAECKKNNRILCHNLLQAAASNNLKNEATFCVQEQKVLVPRLDVVNQIIETDSNVKLLQRVFNFVLITGGLGALGQALADYYIQQGIKKLLLVSRRSEQEITDKNVINNLKRWRSQQVDIRVISADMSDVAQIQSMFSQFRFENIKVAAVVHAAGIIQRHNLTDLPDTEQIQSSFGAKLKGAKCLIEEALIQQPQFILLFSSITSLLGIKGLGLYSGANAALSVQAEIYFKQGHPVYAIDFGRLELEGLMNSEEATVLEQLGVKALEIDKTFEQIHNFPRHTRGRYSLINVDWSTFVPFYNGLNPIGLLSRLNQKPTKKQSGLIDFEAEILSQAQPEPSLSIQCKGDLLDQLAKVVSTQLGIQINADDYGSNLFGLGLNSLLAMTIREHIENITGLSTDSALFFRHQSLEAVAEYLWIGRHKTKVVSSFTEKKLSQTGQVFMFSGQGSQYAGMGKSLYQNEHVFKQHIDLCCEYLQVHFEQDFLEILFDDQHSLLEQTRFAQPALFILEYSMAKWLQHEGIQPDLLIGHSVGEYAAACIAGIFSLQDGVAMICARGQLMQSLPEGGTMVAVFCASEQLPPMISGLSVAAFNGPMQTVISGSDTDITRYTTLLKLEKILYQRLPSKYAFHSALMQPMLAEFRTVLAAVDFQSAQIPVINNLYGGTSAMAMSHAQYWLDQVTASVKFESGIHCAREQGSLKFLEVGPGRVLEGLCQQILSTEQKLQLGHVLSLQSESSNDWKKILQPWLSDIPSLQSRQSQLAPYMIKQLAPENHDAFPLTDMQHAYWLGRHKEVAGGEVAIHMYLELDVKSLDKDRLEKAWNELIQRHGMLRAVVIQNGQQKILPDIAWQIFKQKDYCLYSESECEQVLLNIRDEMSHQVADLTQWPQSDIRISLLPQGLSRVHFSLDGWCIDGWSYQILFHELHGLYHNPSLKLPELALGFRDYVQRLKQLEASDLYQQRLQWWRNKLTDFPLSPQFPRPVAKKDSSQQSFKRWEHRLSPQTYSLLKKKAAKHNLTPATTMMAAFAWVLSRFSERSDICLNVPRFNRLPLHPDVNRLIGEFASFTLLGCHRNSETCFSDFAVSLQQDLWEDLEHPWVSGVTLLREFARAQGENQLTAPFVFTNMPEETLDGEPLEMLNTWQGDAEIGYFLTQTPQVWIDCQYHQHNKGLLVFWDVMEQEFLPGVVDHLFDAYIHLLKLLADEKEDWTFIPDFTTDFEQQKMSVVEGEIGPLMTANHYDFIPTFCKQVKKNPQHLALASTGICLTYIELYQQVYALCEDIQRNLRANELLGQPVIAVMMHKGWQQLVAMLAIHSCGAVALPIDSELPKSRVEYVLRHAQACLLLTQSKTELVSEIKELTSIILDKPMTAGTFVGEISLSQFCQFQSKDDLSLIIYTSGSTGTPKGVMVGTDGLQHAVHYTIKRFELSEQDCFMGLTPLHHDMALFDIFASVVCGATLVIPDADKRKDPFHWLFLMQKYGVTLWNSVPAMMEMLLTVADTQPLKAREACNRLKFCYLGGDWIPLTLPARLAKINPDIRLISVGGPTETTLWNIMYEVNASTTDWRSIPYGSPISNTQYLLVNSLNETCIAGATGEMLVSGVGVAKGYLGDKTQTNAVFIQGEEKGVIYYKTGDLGRLMDDGNIEFVGRKDNQINISGYRMELSEIEAALLRHEAVEQAIVLLLNQNGQKRLVAACTLNNSDKTPTSWIVLKEYLNKLLPAAMVPQEGLILATFPLTANGKVDRKVIGQQILKDKGPKKYSPQVQNRVQEKLLRLWQKNLNRSSLSLDDNYFEVGGNSLLATELFVAISEHFPQLYSVVNLYEFPSIRHLSSFIEQKGVLPAESQSQSRGQLRQQKQLARQKNAMNRIKV